VVQVGRGLALWYKKCATQQSTETPVVDVHFNLWRLPKKGSKNDFLDIGLMLENVQDLESVFLYVPCTLGKAEIKDLGPKFKNAEIVTGVFNEPLKVVSSTAQPYIDILSMKTDPYARVYCFVDSDGVIDENELGVVSQGEGTVLEIKRTALRRALNNDTARKLYFRLRLTFSSIPFIKNIRPKDRYFLSGFESIECVDFRLNQARSIPPSIERRITGEENNQMINIRSVNFLLVTELSAELVGEQSPPHKSRILEKNIWDDYLGPEHDMPPEEMIIYHWKGKTAQNSSVAGSFVPDFSIFAKVQTRKSSLGVYIFVFMVLSIFAGAGGNCFYNYVISKLHSDPCNIGSNNQIPVGAHSVSATNQAKSNIVQQPSSRKSLHTSKNTNPSEK
jgi:hypothetical protein